MRADSKDNDERMLRRALALAALGIGSAAPNPLVGAVVARGNRVVGQGFHVCPGERHAEAVALDDVTHRGETARGATLYTNLEPCCHVGRTPPCVDAIVRGGISRIVAAMRDPNPKVDGKGFRALRSRGVQVEVGLLRAQAMRLNEGFVKLNRLGVPFVTLKGAMSLDGRIATRSGDSKWITSAEVRRHARLLRKENEAVLVGIDTVLEDNPRLDRRPENRRLPSALLRVVLDSYLRLPRDSRLIRAPGPVVVFCASNAPGRRRRPLESLGVEVVELPVHEGRLDLEAALKWLGARGISRLLVEGGGEIHASFLERGLADHLVLYVAPRILGGRDARPLVGGDGARSVIEAIPLRKARWARVGDAWMIEGSLGEG
ncbi:MAG TPA: bifunctional diaminohydroxyphosphoribosylaminopyrimidine deaminase/5-amino-6-(5-phosphoribosylamino)uracil reductase RibD [Vicinamibacteria bacterium]|nr:bifunctional diaminohydroxyphosphoribosylaminopyrimidine deaminase/5-amino-6-(5-phosphoribosylamino)uracil reductase RibD [Vicinamibacteria bacterium]